MHMSNYNKITALYSRLSVGDEDRDGGESNSIQNQELLCKGWFAGLDLIAVIPHPMGTGLLKEILHGAVPLNS